MAALEKFALLGKVYAYLNIFAAIYESAQLMLKIASGNQLMESIISLVLALLWIIMSLVLIIGINKQNIKLVKLHRTFFLVNVIVAMVWGTLKQLYAMLVNRQMRTEMVVIVLVVAFLMLVLCFFILWILNGTIKLIQHNDKMAKVALSDVTSVELINQETNSGK
ncbi:uncharacterized protein LOC120418015 [Culex pipiens pallens]|uniref:uncharacterized protein LOC120418015 n=1 Tax=Culex pipiens pallens TaxID=42434 RepID=UPI001954CD7F|nr:uncharacterized protein LOC120418015 [Culex pipiens pallens]